ncbi:MAG: ATP-binding cassette, subfamily multidrug efflux pump, partial [Pseudonocardiales bacterium]|nr:ATP-binding cassette, subfamily multidrug efflux pump [Pseudonocardiales bacterium]
KTTLVNLILRFYELDEGRITLDGLDITSMRRDQLRAQIGMVLQDNLSAGQNSSSPSPGRSSSIRPC